ncbi:nuclear transport factor 2 family protein [Nocardioides limicola]|uniref:nuclear transport factor 2 family protein n=1 Tax=Nocardioides limicola TaxID=2803368 RepID=UPI00193C33F6|nr:nuclear transport factor 2 family protein [Nocardioides sp. DJM-14]
MDITEISDRLEITALITRYTRAVDTAQFDGIDEVFLDDAELDYSSAGGPVTTPAQAKPFIANLLGFERWQHVIGQVEITLDGDTAHATAYFINPMVAKGADGGEQLWEVGGYYHHDLVRTPDGWRSRRMVDELVWTRMP